MRHVAVDRLCRFSWTPARRYPYAGYKTTPPSPANIGAVTAPRGTVCTYRYVTPWARACVPGAVSPTGVSARNVSRSRQFAKLGKLWRNMRVRRQPVPARDLRLRLLFVVNDVRDKTTLETRTDSSTRRPYPPVSHEQTGRYHGEIRFLFRNTFSDIVCVRRKLIRLSKWSRLLGSHLMYGTVIRDILRRPWFSETSFPPSNCQPWPVHVCALVQLRFRPNSKGDSTPFQKRI